MEYKLPADFPNPVTGFSTGKISKAEVNGDTVCGYTKEWFGYFKYYSSGYKFRKGIQVIGNYLIIYNDDIGALFLRVDENDIITLLVYKRYDNRLIIDYTQKIISHTYNNKIRAYVKLPKIYMENNSANLDLSLLDIPLKLNQKLTLPYTFQDLKIIELYDDPYIGKYLATLFKADKKKLIGTPISHGDCCICMENKADHILNVCKHLAYCDKCAKKQILICPVCRKQNLSIEKIYIP